MNCSFKRYLQYIQKKCCLAVMQQSSWFLFWIQHMSAPPFYFRLHSPLWQSRKNSRRNFAGNILITTLNQCLLSLMLRQHLPSIFCRRSCRHNTIFSILNLWGRQRRVTFWGWAICRIQILCY